MENDQVHVEALRAFWRWDTVNSELDPASKRARLEEKDQGEDKCLKGEEMDTAQVIAKLQEALKVDDIELTKIALKGASAHSNSMDILNFKDENGQTMFLTAARFCNEEICLEILKYGVDKDVMESKGNSVLLYAAQRGFTELVSQLTKCGVNMVCANSALIPAAHFGRIECVHILLKYGALVNYANAKGTSSLMRAAQEGHLEVSKILLDGGADANNANNEGMTALMLASQRGHTGIVRMLIQKGAYVNMKTRQGSTALLLASKRGHEQTVIVLVTNGADIFQKDDRHKTAYAIAKRRGFHKLLVHLTMEAQINLMQQATCVERCHTMVLMSHLLSSSRATLREDLMCSDYANGMSIAMRLPLSIVKVISKMLGKPPLYDKRIQCLRWRALTNPQEVVTEIMPLFDALLLDVVTSASKFGSKIFPCIETTRLDPNSFEKELVVTDLLLELRDNPLFAFKFRTWGNTALPLKLLDQLKNLANLQGVIRSYGSVNVAFNQFIAFDVITTFEVLLKWTKQRFQLTPLSE